MKPSLSISDALARCDYYQPALPAEARAAAVRRANAIPFLLLALLAAAALSRSQVAEAPPASTVASR